MEIREDINDVAKLTEIATKYNAVHWPVWFRGQADVSWELIPKVWRNARAITLERTVTETFLTYAHSRSRRCPSEADLGGWLSLMQHYGAPTRLLDWTTSIMIAAYFAVVEARTPPVDGALFMIPPKALNRSEGQGDRILSLGRSPELVVSAFYPSVRRPRIDAAKSRAAAAVGDEVDPRQAAQQSVFTVHPPDCGNLMLHPDVATLVTKYRIPIARKAAILEGLEQLGVTKQTIFPDLQGLGDYLRELHETGRIR